jgi:hypothetical protein
VQLAGIFPNRNCRRREAWQYRTVQRRPRSGGLNKHEVSVGEFAAKLALDKSVTSRRLAGRNRPGLSGHPETCRGPPARIVLGDGMPEMVKLLPEPGELGA